MVTEQVIVFGPESSMVGIITDPPEGRRDQRLPGVILLSAGLINRVGPNRLYVKLARALAEAGFTVWRFDLSGIGDSQPRSDNLPLGHAAVLDTADAITWFHAARRIERFVLVGHCSGAWYSLIGAYILPYIYGAVALNLEPGSDDWTAYDRQRKMSQYYLNYYARSILPKGTRWRRLLRGEVNYRSVVRSVLQGIVANSISAIAFRARVRLLQLSPWQQPTSVAEESGAVRALTWELMQRGQKVMFIHPEGSTGSEFLDAASNKAREALLESGHIRIERLAHSDHLYTLLASQEALIDLVRDAVLWMVPSENQQAAAS